LIDDVTQFTHAALGAHLTHKSVMSPMAGVCGSGQHYSWGLLFR
jgi:hypothetical protein